VRGLLAEDGRPTAHLSAARGLDPRRTRLAAVMPLKPSGDASWANTLTLNKTVNAALVHGSEPSRLEDASTRVAVATASCPATAGAPAAILTATATRTMATAPATAASDDVPDHWRNSCRRLVVRFRVGYVHCMGGIAGAADRPDDRHAAAHRRRHRTCSCSGRPDVQNDRWAGKSLAAVSDSHLVPTGDVERLAYLAVVATGTAATRAAAPAPSAPSTAAATAFAAFAATRSPAADTAATATATDCATSVAASAVTATNTVRAARSASIERLCVASASGTCIGSSASAAVTRRTVTSAPSHLPTPSAHSLQATIRCVTARTRQPERRRHADFSGWGERLARAIGVEELNLQLCQQGGRPTAIRSEPCKLQPDDQLVTDSEDLTVAAIGVDAIGSAAIAVAAPIAAAIASAPAVTAAAVAATAAAATAAWVVGGDAPIASLERQSRATVR